MKHLLVFCFAIIFHYNYSQIRQTFGIGYGFTFGSVTPYKDKLRQDISLRFDFNYIRFMVKTQIGLRPNTHYGTQFTGLFSLGFTTPINKILSWHITTGLKLGEASKPNVDGLTYSAGSFALSGGIYINPFKTRKIIIGIDADLHREYATTGHGKWGYTYKNDQPSVYLSINYLIKKDKAEKVSN